MSNQESRSEILPALAKRVATALGKGWRYLGPGHGIYGWGKELIGNNRYKVSFETVYCPKECLELRAILPDEWREYVALPGHSSPIRLAVRRPGRIAAALVRTLLPKYRKLCKLARANKAEHDTYLQKQEANLRILAKALGIELTEQTRWVGGPKGSKGCFATNEIDVRTTHKNASITLHSISISKAKLILRILRRKARRPDSRLKRSRD